MKIKTRVTAPQKNCQPKNKTDKKNPKITIHNFSQIIKEYNTEQKQLITIYLRMIHFRGVK